MAKTDYDVVVVGAGPNGLAAAIRLQQAGLSVYLAEARHTIGGGMRTVELTLPGFRHDICSAVHPLGLASPYFSELPLQEQGLEWLHAPIAAAHPLDDGEAALLYRSLQQTADTLGDDAQVYYNLLSPLINNWPVMAKNILGPLRWPDNLPAMAGFGRHAFQSAERMAKKFTTPKARALWAGVAAHGIIPLDKSISAAAALVLLVAAHRQGWPLPRGGSQSLADALGAVFMASGGVIQTGFTVQSIDQLPTAKAVLFDLSPKPLLQIAGHRFSPLYRRQLEKYRYGPGVFKMDWAIEGEIPFRQDVVRQAGTVHLGNHYENIASFERHVWEKRFEGSPFVLLAQPSLVDDTRAPEGRSAVWGYCHVPAGSVTDYTEAVEQQVERFAPGFRDRILARHIFTAAQMETYNPNYVGGDINAGVLDITQLFTRPALRWSPYRTSKKGLYICSAATPPGGGVHGMCGWHAANRVMKDIFRIE